MSEENRRGVHIIAFARMVRWIGWGFGEPLLPLFMAMFAATFAGAGFIRSTYDIVTLLALPVIGLLADRYPARTLILFSLLLYPLVGLSYFLAGVTGFAVFVIFARVINGGLWGLESLAVDTYYRRMVPSGQLGQSFGYIDMLANFGWILAALSGIWLVKLFPIYYLLLAVIPFSLVAYAIARRAPADTISPTVIAATVGNTYRTLFNRFLSWDRRLWALGAIVFFGQIVNTLSTFFLPIYVYQETGDPTQAIIIAVASAIPSLFGYYLGMFVDRVGERKVFAIGFLMVSGALTTIFFFPYWTAILAAILVIEIALVLMNLTQRTLLTKLSSADIWGERGSAMEGLSVIGAIVGPIGVGILFDLAGAQRTFLTLAIMSLVMLLLSVTIFRKQRP